MSADNYPELIRDTNTALRSLRKDLPDVFAGFGSLTQAAHKGEAIDKKTKELIALGIAVAIRCDACIGYHIEALVKLGATRQEVAEGLGVAVQMQGGPGMMYAAAAMKAFEQFSAAQG
jgi:AhpD family alkylhydroperoxidase